MQAITYSWLLLALIALLLFALVPACASSPSPKVTEGPTKAFEASDKMPTSEPVPGGLIVLDVQPRAATVVVDGQAVSRVDALPGRGVLKLSRSVHRIEVRHPGYRSFRIELSVGERAEMLHIRLERRPTR